VSGREPDWALRSASLGFLHKAAYLTQDGRWLAYRDRTGVDLNKFRLGQSYWPEPSLTATPPADLVGSWQINPMPQPMWQWRQNGFALDESFLFMSYRNRTDHQGDFVLLDGFNGASRNPYHTFAILELRVDGRTILEGYHNQLRTRVEDLHVGVALDLICCNHPGAFGLKVKHLGLAGVQLEHQLFHVQHNIRDVFMDSLDRGEFVKHAIDSDGCNSRTPQ